MIKKMAIVTAITLIGFFMYFINIIFNIRNYFNNFYETTAGYDTKK